MKNKKKLGLLFFINGNFVFASNLLGPLFAIFAEKFDNNILTVSYGWFILMIFTLITTFVMSRDGDKVNRKSGLLVVGFLIRAVAWTAFIFIDNKIMFFVIQAILGIGEGVGSPAFDAIMADWIESHHRIKFYSRWKIISSLCLAVSSLIGGLIVANFGFNALFLVMVLLALLSAYVGLSLDK